MARLMQDSNRRNQANKTYRAAVSRHGGKSPQTQSQLAEYDRAKEEAKQSAVLVREITKARKDVESAINKVSQTRRSVGDAESLSVQNTPRPASPTNPNRFYR